MIAPNVMGGHDLEPRAVRKLGGAGTVEWHSAVAPGGVGCLLLRGTDRDVIRTIAEAHVRVNVDVCPVPWAHDLDAPSPWVAFECDPIGTFDELVDRWPRRSVPYSEAIVVTHTLGRMMRAAHERGVCVGALSPAQVLVDRSGGLKLLALGFDERTWDARAVRAPSVGLGHPPTPTSDLHTGLLFLRPYIPWIESVPAPLARLLSGAPGPVERVFSRALVGTLTQAVRLDGAWALSNLERFWSFVGVAPAHEAMAERLRRTFDEGTPRVDLGPDLSWVSVDGGPRHDLTRREPVRRVLRVLVEARGSSVPVERLVASAWPGEAMVGSSGADRVYVALSTLRKLDLREAIAREPTGYALRATVTLRDA